MILNFMLFVQKSKIFKKTRTSLTIMNSTYIVMFQATQIQTIIQRKKCSFVLNIICKHKLYIMKKTKMMKVILIVIQMIRTSKINKIVKFLNNLVQIFYKKIFLKSKNLNHQLDNYHNINQLRKIEIIAKCNLKNQ